MSYNAINLCSTALLKLGAQSISSFEEGTVEAEVAGRLYPMVRDALLSSYPWSFAVGHQKLNRLASAPLVDFQYSYALPNDFLRIISAGCGTKGSGIEYRIFENRLHTNVSEVNLTYIRRPEEESFPAFFYDALSAKLAAEFCLPLTENSSRAQDLYKYADQVITAARLTDAQQSTPQKFEDFSLIGVRK